LLGRLSVDEIDGKLKDSGFEMIVADTDAMSNADYMHFEAINKTKFKRRKNQREGGVPRTDGKIAPPPKKR
jgi:hypothetical protein